MRTGNLVGEEVAAAKEAAAEDEDEDDDEDEDEKELRELEALEEEALTKLAAAKARVDEKRKKIWLREMVAKEVALLGEFEDRLRRGHDVVAFAGTPPDWLSNDDDPRLARVSRFKQTVLVECDATVLPDEGRETTVSRVDAIKSITVAKPVAEKLAGVVGDVQTEVIRVLQHGNTVEHLLSIVGHARVRDKDITSDATFDHGDTHAISARITLDVFVAKTLLAASALVAQIVLPQDVIRGEITTITSVALLSARHAFVITGDRCKSWAYVTDKCHGRAHLVDIVEQTVVWKAVLPASWLCDGHTNRDVRVSTLDDHSVLRYDANGGQLISVDVSTPEMKETVLWSQIRRLTTACVLPDGWVTALEWVETRWGMSAVPRFVSGKIGSDAAPVVDLDLPEMMTGFVISAFIAPGSGEARVNFVRGKGEVTMSVNPLLPSPNEFRVLSTRPRRIRSSIWSRHLLSHEDGQLVVLDPATGEAVSKIRIGDAHKVSRPVGDTCVSCSDDTLYVWDLTKAS